MRTLIVAAILAASPAFARVYENDTMVAKRGADVIRLWETPCVHAGTLGLIKPEFRERFKKARAMIGGVDFYACWTMEENAVFVLFEDGDQSVVPVSEFKPEQGA
jgi:hypothetical protein